MDKTGTLTRNELKVTAVHPMPGFDESHVLGLAALASSDGGQDPVDAVIRSAASQTLASDLPKPTKFVPFDPATKMSAATALDPSGATVRSKTARRLDPRLFDALRFTEIRVLTAFFYGHWVYLRAWHYAHRSRGRALNVHKVS